MVKNINAALSGRGGGRPEMIQGSFGTDIESIRSYFIK
jgi:alanyl-tRNA synthetase